MKIIIYNFIDKSKKILSQIKKMLEEKNYKFEQIEIINQLDKKHQLEKDYFVYFKMKKKEINLQVI